MAVGTARATVGTVRNAAGIVGVSVGASCADRVTVTTGAGKSLAAHALNSNRQINQLARVKSFIANEEGRAIMPRPQ